MASRSLGQLTIDLVARTGSFEQGMSKAERSTKRSMQQITVEVERASASITRAVGIATTALGTIGAGLSVRELIQYTDTWKGINNQLRQVAGSEAELSRVRSELLAISNSTNAELEVTVGLYSELYRSTRSLNTAQKDVAAVTETINNLFKAGGKSANETAGAVRQLSQALASGALRGDEFNSVAEGAPRILDALETSLNMNRKELREFAAEGKITSAIMVDALLAYQEQAQQMADLTEETFGQKMVVARNNVTKLAGEAGALNSALGLMGDGIVGLSGNLDKLVKIGEAFAAVIAARSVPALAAYVAAATTATTITNVYGQRIVVATAAQRAMAASTTALNGALALLGGPAGLFILASYGVVRLVSSLESYEERSRRLRGEIDSLTESQTRSNLAFAEGELEAARASAARALLTSNRSEADRLAYERQAARVAEVEGRIAAYEERLETLRRRGLDPVNDALTENAGNLEDVADAAVKAALKVDDLALSYKLKLQTLGMTDRQLGIHEALLRASALETGRNLDAELEAINAYYDAVEALKRKEDAQRAAADAAEELRRANERAAEESARVWLSFSESFRRTFADMVLDHGNALDAMVKSTKRAALEIIGSGIFDLGAGLGSKALGLPASPGTSIFSAGATGTAASLLDRLANPKAVISKGELAQLLGQDTPAGFGMADITNLAKSLGAGIAGSFAGTLAGESIFGKQAESQWGATAGGLVGTYLGGPLGSFIGSALGSMVDVAFGGDGKLRTNAGLLTAPTPGLKGEYNAGSHQFASGVKATLFARRADTQAARDILAVFDQVDRSYVDLIEALGGSVAAEQLTGLNEEAAAGSRGAFFGVGGNGTTQGDIMAQAASWVQQLTNYTSGLDEALLQNVKSAETAEEALSLLAEAVAADELKNAWESIKDSMDPLRVRTRAYEADLQILTQIFAEGSQEFAEAADQLKVFHGLAKSAEELARAEKELADQRRRVQIEYMGWVRSQTDGALRMLADSIRNETKIREDAHSRAIDLIREEATLRTQANQLALDAAQDGLQRITSELQGLGSAADALRGLLAPAQVRDDAIALLRSALSSGDLTGVGEAAGIAAQIDAKNFASAADFAREQAKTLNLIGALQEDGEDQVDHARDAVKRLEEQIELIRKTATWQEAAENERHSAELAALQAEFDNAQDQLNVLRGIESGVLSLSEALNRVGSALARETAAQGAANAAIPYTAADITGFYNQQIASGASAFDAASAIRARAIAEGYNSADVARTLGWSGSQLEDFLHELGIPGFAAGGRHTGGWRIVGESGPELEFTGPSSILNNAATMRALSGGGGDAAIIQELQRINERLTKLEDYGYEQTKASKKIDRQLERWDVDGLPQEREPA